MNNDGGNFSLKVIEERSPFSEFWSEDIPAFKNPQALRRPQSYREGLELKARTVISVIINILTNPQTLCRWMISPWVGS